MQRRIRTYEVVLCLDTSYTRTLRGDANLQVHKMFFKSFITQFCETGSLLLWTKVYGSTKYFAVLQHYAKSTGVRISPIAISAKRYA